MADQPAQQSEHHFLAMTPLSLLFMTVVSAVVFFFFTQLQITATEQSVFGLLQQTVTLQPGLTGMQAQSFLNGELSRNQTVAYGLGWSVQVALLFLSFSPDAILHAVHKKHGEANAINASKQAAKLVKIRQFMEIVLIGGDVFTDFLYVVQGHTITTGTIFGFIPAIGGISAAGVFIVGIVYPIGVCYVTIYSAKFMFAYLDALIAKIRHTS